MKAIVKQITPKEVNGSKFVLVQMECAITDSIGTIKTNVWATRQTVDAKLKVGAELELDASKIVAKQITAYGKQVTIRVLGA